MTTHPARKSGVTQCDTILSELEANAGEWVSMPRLYQVSKAIVHSRISDLRARGHKIEQKSVHKGGKVHSSYRLIS